MCERRADIPFTEGVSAWMGPPARRAWFVTTVEHTKRPQAGASLSDLPSVIAYLAATARVFFQKAFIKTCRCCLSVVNGVPG